jgi:hypothetical protein
MPRDATGQPQLRQVPGGRKRIANGRKMGAALPIGLCPTHAIRAYARDPLFLIAARLSLPRAPGTEVALSVKFVKFIRGNCLQARAADSRFECIVPASGAVPRFRFQHLAAQPPPGAEEIPIAVGMFHVEQLADVVRAAAGKARESAME